MQTVLASGKSERMVEAWVANSAIAILDGAFRKANV
jgi:hypothetical protein